MQENQHAYFFNEAVLEELYGVLLHAVYRLAHPFSDYGKLNVDLFALGSDIYSTVQVTDMIINRVLVCQHL